MVPVVDHGRCEAKRACVAVCTNDVFEVRRMDPEDSPCWIDAPACSVVAW